MVQVSEGGLGEISNVLTRLRELAVQASSDTVGDNERGFIDKEVQQLKSEIQRIAESTRYGDRKLLDGSGSEYSFQIDINNDDFQDRISFNASEQVPLLMRLELKASTFLTKIARGSPLKFLRLLKGRSMVTAPISARFKTDLFRLLRI